MTALPIIAPCPCCGAPAGTSVDNDGYAIVACVDVEKCGLMIPTGEYIGTRRPDHAPNMGETIRRWNRRA